MERVEEFPFGAGQKVESRSNIKGFRGAWFRSEIKNVQIRRGEIWCAMHYIDFPDEKTNFMKAYQQDPSGKKKRVLMVRPSFPVLSMGVEESIIKDAAGPVVVVNGDWSVGDLVDWFTDGCFWAAKIIAVLNKEFVQVELPSAPLGEGGGYEAAVKDIRPSLDWSMDKFWTVPSGKFHPPTLKALTMMDGSFTSPVKNYETLKTEHIFIAKQDPARISAVKTTLAGLDEAQPKRKPWGLGSESENKNVPGISNSNTSSQHAHTIMGIVPELFPVTAVKDSAVVTLDMQKSDCAWITSLDDQKFAPLNSHGRGFTDANKPPNKGQLLPYTTSDQRLGSGSCQTQEVANQVHIRETDDIDAPQKPLPQTNAVDLNGKVGFEQTPLGRSDALNTLNDMGETLLFKEFNALLGDGKLLDLSDERVGSSIMALEELLSRLAWLKGVMHLGLKGWCKERRKRKWVFCEMEGLPLVKSENDVSCKGSEPT